MKAIIVTLAALFLAACASPAPAPDTVSLMAFNVENLFDTKDDPGRDDKTFLPAAAKSDPGHIAACNAIEVDRWRAQCLEWDWNAALLETKLERVAAAILQVNNGRGPDVVALQEIENLAILERLRTEHLSSAGYAPAVLIEGQDQRGIDVAFLSRLPLASTPVLHPLTFDDSVPIARQVDTRGVLQADFELPDGRILTGLSVHFPAPFHPTHMREAAYAHLNALLADLPTDRAVFAAGDFNTTSAEDREAAMLDRLVRPHWLVAHDLGCGDCAGTHYYAPSDSWSFLDMLLYRGDGHWRINQVVVPRDADGQTRTTAAGRIPNRFSPAGGISDHFPLLVYLQQP